MKIEKVDAEQKEVKQVRRTREVSVEDIPLKTPGVKLPPLMKKENVSASVRYSKNKDHINLIEEDIIPVEYSIKYECLCLDKIEGIPKELHYKPIGGFEMTKLNELNSDNFDTGINTIMDSLCYESKFNKFSHWLMPNSEKIRSFINLRINSESEFIETAIGVCQSCGQAQPFINLKLTSFDEDELKPRYKEPFQLKIIDCLKKEVKFKVRMIQSGDNQFALKVFKDDKQFIRETFDNFKSEDEKFIIQVLEYSNSIVSIGDQEVDYSVKVKLCVKNVEAMKAITSFNDNFYYGMKLSKEEKCQNDKCPSNDDTNLKKEPNRGSLFHFPFQPSLFYISGESKADKYFDDDNEGN